MVAQPGQEGKLNNFIVLPFLFGVFSNALKDSAWSQKFLFPIFDKLLSPGSIKSSVPGSLLVELFILCRAQYSHCGGCFLTRGCHCMSLTKLDKSQRS